MTELNSSTIVVWGLNLVVWSMLCCRRHWGTCSLIVPVVVLDFWTECNNLCCVQMALKSSQFNCTSSCIRYLDWVRWSMLCAYCTKEITFQQYLYGVWVECSIYAVCKWHWRTHSSTVPVVVLGFWIDYGDLCFVPIAMKKLLFNCRCMGFGLSAVT